MKILKIFGVVVGIHVFALILIFANPGCTSSTKTVPAPIDTVAKTDASGAGITLPPMTGSPMAVSTGFNPDAPATASGGSRGYAPTRPNTPAATTLVAPPVADVLPAERYTVKPGDSLWSIANKHHLTPGELAAQNGLKAGVVLQPGQKLLITAKPAAVIVNPPAGAAKAGPGASTAKSPAPVAAAANGMKHTVKPGETLSAIAHQYGVTVRELGAANNITDPQKVPAGAVLVIPGWQPAGGTVKGATKSGKAPDTAAAPAAPQKIFNILDPSNAPPATSAEPPVNKVEDNPLTPTAPKK